MEARRTILIAEDVDMIRSLLARSFKRKYEVIEAVTGDEAIERITGDMHGRLHAVLTDYSMPPGEKTGMDVVKAAVRAGVPNVAIMTGGHGDRLDADKLKISGIRVFEKPVENRTLLDWLAESENPQDA